MQPSQVLLLSTNVSSTPQHLWGAQPPLDAQRSRRTGSYGQLRIQQETPCTDPTNHTHRAHTVPSAFSSQPISRWPLHSFVQKRGGREPEACLAFSSLSFLPFFGSPGVTTRTRLFIAFVSTYNQISFPDIMQLSTSTPGGMNPVQCPPPTLGCSHH